MNYIGIIKRQTLIIFCSVLVLTITILGISYATVFKVNSTSNNQVVHTGTLDVTFSSSNSVSEQTFSPMSDEDGLKTDAYTFNVNNSGTLPATYKVLIFNKQITSASYLSHDLIKISIDGNTPVTLSSLDTYNTTSTESQKQYVLTTGTLDSGADVTHNVRVWLSEDATTSDTDKNISLQIKIVSVVNE